MTITKFWNKSLEMDDEDEYKVELILHEACAQFHKRFGRYPNSKSESFMEAHLAIFHEEMRDGTKL